MAIKATTHLVAPRNRRPTTCVPTVLLRLREARLPVKLRSIGRTNSVAGVEVLVCPELQGKVVGGTVFSQLLNDPWADCRTVDCRRAPLITTRVRC